MIYEELGARIILSFGDGKVFVTESTIFGIIVAIVIAVICIWLGHGLKTVPKGKQIIAEFIVEWIYKFTKENMGEENSRFAPYIGSIFAFMVCGSMLGIFGIRPITADVNVAFALSIMTFVMIQYNAVKTLGIRGKIKSMCDPYPFMLPLKVLEDVTLPVSLGFRLFGNMLGGVIVIDLWMNLMTMLSNYMTDIPFLRAITVLPLNGFFDMFEPAIQTYIFVTLTSVFLSMGMKKTH
ncbi:MAG: FoF1 ATP synthase subunit a [Anaerovoracaceae bacterium]